jgi:hypothetical protein
MRNNEMQKNKYIKLAINVCKIIENERADAWTIGGHLINLSEPDSLKNLGVSTFSELVSIYFSGYPLNQAKRCVEIRKRLESLGYDAYGGKAICKTMANTRLEELLPFIPRKMNTSDFVEWASTTVLPKKTAKKTYRLSAETLEKINFLYQTEDWTKGELLENLVDSYLGFKGHLTRDGKLRRASASALKAA